jgi:hypothetical protein
MMFHAADSDLLHVTQAGQLLHSSSKTGLQSKTDLGAQPSPQPG